MQYVITELDKMLIQQEDIKCKIRITILLHNKIVDVLTGIPQIGEFVIDAESNIRRATNLDIKLDDRFINIEGKIESYLNLDFLIEVGIYNNRIDDYTYYQLGILCITTANTSYDATNNILSINLSDWFAKLDNTRNGQVGGSPTIVIPVEFEDSKNTLKTAMISIISSETTIKDYIIEDIGEYYGMPQNNPDYMAYRKLNPDWNIIPYDLKFSAGDSVSDLLITIRDLYPNCQLYFDIYNNLCFDMFPSNNKNPVILNNDYIQSILLSDNSEEVQYDTSSIKNVIEVMGKTYDIDRFSSSVSYNNNVYILSLESYSSYQSYELIAFSAIKNNSSQSMININNIGNIPIYKEYTTEYIPKNTICTNDMVVIKIMKDLDGNYIAYYLGQYQPHALCVLTNNINDTYYTKQYFAEKYNCLEKNIAFIESKESPFSIQKLGIIFENKSGDDYDNIISDSIALDNAKYLIYKSSVWNDIVTIKTKLIPWLDVNIKVEYRKQQENDVHTYIIKKIQHDFMNGATTITMYRFHSLYQE